MLPAQEGNRMATAEEIKRRVEQTDTARSAQRATAAQEVGALAQRRAVVAEQLADIDAQLGDVLAEASKVMSIDELAAFTDIPAADLTQWLTARKTARTKRKPRPATGTDGAPSRVPSTAKASTTRSTAAPPDAAPARIDNTAPPARVPAEVT
jgi:hypothetical protein